MKKSPGNFEELENQLYRMTPLPPSGHNYLGTFLRHVTALAHNLGVVDDFSSVLQRGPAKTIQKLIALDRDCESIYNEPAHRYHKLHTYRTHPNRCQSGRTLPPPGCRSRRNFDIESPHAARSPRSVLRTGLRSQSPAVHRRNFPRIFRILISLLFSHHGTHKGFTFPAIRYKSVREGDVKSP